MSAPRLTVETTPGVPPRYALKGWEEFDRHAINNHPVWNRVTERCRVCGLSETERLKMLCAIFLEIEQRCTAAAVAEARLRGVSLPEEAG